MINFRILSQVVFFILISELVISELVISDYRAAQPLSQRIFIQASVSAFSAATGRGTAAVAGRVAIFRYQFEDDVVRSTFCSGDAVVCQS